MMIGFLTFGVVCGATAAVLVMMSGAGLLAAFAAYALVGSAGLLAIALPAAA